MNQSEDLPTENIGSEVINHRKELLDVLNSLATNQEIQATLGISAGHEKDNPEFWRIQRLTMIDRFRIMLLCQLKLDVMTQVDDMTPGVQHQLAVLGKTQIDDGLKYSEVRRWWNLSGRFVTLQAKCLREERILLETHQLKVLVIFERGAKWLKFENNFTYTLVADEVDASAYEIKSITDTQRTSLDLFAQKFDFIKREVGAKEIKVLVKGV